jgi:LmbE family N-acetylglucosaminyl deacetylase
MGGKSSLNKSLKNNEKRTLLAVLAHPDDESFGMGGTLALYARQGVAAHLVCATRGEVGEMAPEFMQGFNSVEEVREAELRCAAQKLGLASVRFLGYRDSGMPGSPDNRHTRALAAAPLEEVAAKIAHIIRELCPQVIVTFDPLGGYRHPDHIAIHQATVRAFALAADPAFQDGQAPFQAQKLYFHTIPRRIFRWGVRLLPIFGKDPRRWGQNGDIDLVALASDEFPTHATINYGSVKAIKAEAAFCHASQGGSRMVTGLMGWVQRLGGSKENFMRAYPPPEPRREFDLFDGVRSK